MKILTEETLLNNLEKFVGLIENHIAGDRKTKLLNMYKGMEEELVIAPASPRESAHNAFVGGYVDHVLRVVEYSILFDRVWDKLGQKKNYTVEELVFSAINHDLGKLGYDNKPHYVPNDSEWHIKNQGANYKLNPALNHMRISDRSLFILQKYGIPVSENEFLAIKLHDGLYEEANKVYYMTSGDFEIKSNLPFVLHQADLTASRIEKQNN